MRALLRALLRGNRPLFTSRFTYHPEGLLELAIVFVIVFLGASLWAAWAALAGGYITELYAR